MARAKTSPAKTAKIKRDSKAWHAAVAFAADHVRVIVDNDEAAKVPGADMIQPVLDAAAIVAKQFMLLDCMGNETNAKAFRKEIAALLNVKTATARVIISNCVSLSDDKGKAAVKAAIAAGRYKPGKPYEIATVWKYARDYTPKGAEKKAQRDAERKAALETPADPTATTEPEPEWKFNERLIERSRIKPVTFTAKFRKDMTTVVNQACKKLAGDPDAIRAMGLELLERANDLREKAASA